MLKVKHGKNSHKAKQRYARVCNLCGISFVAKIPHRCFCDDCKMSSDLYRFHDWLPDALPESWELESHSSEQTGEKRAA